MGCLRLWGRVWVAALLSTLMSLGAARAHEVVPTVAEFQVDGTQITVTLTGAVEAFVAGLDLDGLTDTNDSAASDDYDRLRALPPADLAGRVAEAWPGLAGRIQLRADGAPVALTLDDVDAGAVGSVDLPRNSTLHLTGDLGAASYIELDWPADLGALVLRQQGVDAPYTGYLSGGASTGPIALSGTSQTAWQTFFSYIPVGFDHILPKGLDHILFVLGLFFLAPRLGPLLWQVTAFTAAHTITLALAALGWVVVPGSVVEPLIALSIAWVALENVWRRDMTPWRPLLVFGFGLLHGLGFASVLADFGLPQAQFIPALLGFNVGVEVGQLAVIAAAFLLTMVALRYDAALIDRGRAVTIALALVAVSVALLVLPGDLRLLAVTAVVLTGLSAVSVVLYQSYRAAVAIPASLIIAAVGLWWAYERVFL